MGELRVKEASITSEDDPSPSSAPNSLISNSNIHPGFFRTEPKKKASAGMEKGWGTQISHKLR
jgi:hypothetical protein